MLTALLYTITERSVLIMRMLVAHVQFVFTYNDDGERSEMVTLTCGHVGVFITLHHFTATGGPIATPT